MKAEALEESLRHRMSTFFFVKPMAHRVCLDPKKKFKNPKLTPRLKDIIDICTQRDFPPLQTVDALTQVTYQLMPRLYLNGIIVGRRIKDCINLAQLARSSIDFQYLIGIQLFMVKEATTGRSFVLDKISDSHLVFNYSSYHSISSKPEEYHEGASIQIPTTGENKFVQLVSLLNLYSRTIQEAQDEPMTQQTLDFST